MSNFDSLWNPLHSTTREFYCDHGIGSIKVLSTDFAVKFVEFVKAVEIFNFCVENIAIFL